MPTWPPCCKTSAVLRFLSIPSKTTPTCSSTLDAPYQSVRWSRMLRSLPRNGSKIRGRNSLALFDNRVMEPSRFPNPKSKPFGITSPINANTTLRFRLKKNIGSFLNDIRLRLMSLMCRIERIRPGFQPSIVSGLAAPGPCPGLTWGGALPLWIEVLNEIHGKPRARKCWATSEDCYD